MAGLPAYGRRASVVRSPLPKTESPWSPPEAGKRGQSYVAKYRKSVAPASAKATDFAKATPGQVLLCGGFGGQVGGHAD